MRRTPSARVIAGIALVLACDPGRADAGVLDLVARLRASVARVLERLDGLPPPATKRVEGPRWRPYDAITRDVLLGEAPERFGYDALAREHVGAVLSLRDEARDDGRWLREHGIAHARIRVVDYEAPSPEQLREAVAWIRSEVAKGHKVYVHCKGGVGRSANVVAAYLAAERGWSADRALAFVQARRPIVKQTPGQLAALRAFASSGGAPGTSGPSRSRGFARELERGFDRPAPPIPEVVRERVRPAEHPSVRGGR